MKCGDLLVGGILLIIGAALLKQGQSFGAVEIGLAIVIFSGIFEKLVKEEETKNQFII